MSNVGKRVEWKLSNGDVWSGEIVAEEVDYIARRKANITLVTIRWPNRQSETTHELQQMEKNTYVKIFPREHSADPDLLSACEAALDALECSPKFVENEHTIKLLRAAIAKAKGVNP